MRRLALPTLILGFWSGLIPLVTLHLSWAWFQ